MDFSNPLIYIIPGLAIFGYIVKWIIKVERWMGKIDESIRLLEEGAREMRTDITSIQVVEKNSPLRLTEAGHSISEALDVKDRPVGCLESMPILIRHKSLKNNDLPPPPPKILR